MNTIILIAIAVYLVGMLAIGFKYSNNKTSEDFYLGGRKLGPIVTLRDYMEVFPFGEPLYSIKLTGAQLRHVMQFMLRDDAFIESMHTQWYQLSGGTRIVYDRPNRTIVSFTINGEEVQDDKLYSVIVEKFHYLNLDAFFDLKKDDIERNGAVIKVASSTPNVLEEYFVSHPLVELSDAPRIIVQE